MLHSHAAPLSTGDLGLIGLLGLDSVDLFAASSLTIGLRFLSASNIASRPHAANGGHSLNPLRSKFGDMASTTIDIAKLEGLANALTQGLETLLAEVMKRQEDESQRLSKYKCLAAQVCALLMLRNLPHSA